MHSSATMSSVNTMSCMHTISSGNNARHVPREVAPTPDTFGANISVADIMSRHVPAVFLEQTMRETKELCDRMDSHFVLVADSTGKIFGVTCRCHLEIADPDAAVSQVTEQQGAGILGTQDVLQARALMHSTRIECLPVVDGDGCVAGVLTREDLRIFENEREPALSGCAECGASHHLTPHYLDRPKTCPTCSRPHSALFPVEEFRDREAETWTEQITEAS